MMYLRLRYHIFLAVFFFEILILILSFAFHLLFPFQAENGALSTYLFLILLLGIKQNLFSVKFRFGKKLNSKLLGQVSSITEKRERVPLSGVKSKPH